MGLKVDREDGKRLTTNDFTSDEKQKLADLENYIPPSSQPIVFIEELQTTLDELAQNLGLKVDREDGKGLSSNDFTSDEKQKLADLENYIPPSSQPIVFIEELQTTLDELALGITPNGNTLESRFRI